MDRISDLEIRQSVPDIAAIERLYPAAFPDEDLLPLVRRLLCEPAATSLIASDGQLVGHVIFTHCGIEGSDAQVALLGPLAVAPTSQRQGIGSAIVRHGLRKMQTQGIKLVLVLGDPAYYERLGFHQNSNIEPPYALRDEWSSAWQSLSLDPSTRCSGKLVVPKPWLQPALWAP